ncbi:MAG: lytic transglycosylase domain-containing protein [Xanthobacteraceae bacterium]|nr:lytic transglycosylase domain-containing protein [Xanthobacteraceae bacterium]
MAVDNTFASAIDSVRAKIAGTIKQAASATGASFEYLISAAKIESNLDPRAAASTSSARGLYQFIEQTWLGTVKEAGASFGFGKYADAISKSSSGSYSVSDSQTREEILKLRDDPAANAAMAGVLTQSNSFKLTADLGRRPTDGELYMAHFMGVGGASKLISAAEDNPRASAAAMFPGAAAANRSIFYNRGGTARSVSEVYADLNGRYASAANSPVARTAMAAAGLTPSNGTSQVAAADNAAYLSSFPQSHTQMQVRRPQQLAALETKTAPTFYSLFQAGERSDPVSPTVRELWGNGSSLTSVPASAPVKAGTDGAPRPLDLFSDRAGVFSG